MEERPMTVPYDIPRFVSDVKQILAADGPNDAGLARIAVRMQELTRNLELAIVGDIGNVHAGRQSEPLYTDDSGLTLVRARFGPEAMTPIHNHGSWGVVGVYHGRDLYQVWQRLDDGSQPGQAQVALVEERILEAGEAVVLPPPPQDIHAQQGFGGEPVYEFVLFGKNTMRLTRLYFDPHQGTAREVRRD
jgi:predicted metal-dependent enzyme (double-stranded beta helix superfamily)